MNNGIKIVVSLGAAGLMALTLCSCDNTGGTYVPDPVAADYSAMNTAVLAHPGQHCVLEWGMGLYTANCYPVGVPIGYSIRIYYPSGYCGCWGVAPRPANYSVTYVKRGYYTPGRTTNVTVNKNVTVNNGSKSAPKTPKDAVPRGYTGTR